MSSNATTNSILSVEQLTIGFANSDGSWLYALKDASISINEAEIVGLVGESGSGKTVLSHTILGLNPAESRVFSGSIQWNGTNILGSGENALRQIRGSKISMIFQDAQASLNPLYPVGRQVEWILDLHRNLRGKAAEAEVLSLFNAVQLRNPERCMRAFPRELSGGMCQRVMIAMALAGQPKLLIADEPTSALDVSVAAEIVSLLAKLRQMHNLAVLIITHDLALATKLADRIAVIDQGTIVENIPSQSFMAQARHPASKKLTDASRYFNEALFAGFSLQSSVEDLARN